MTQRLILVNLFRFQTFLSQMNTVKNVIKQKFQKITLPKYKSVRKFSESKMPNSRKRNNNDLLNRTLWLLRAFQILKIPNFVQSFRWTYIMGIFWNFLTYFLSFCTLVNFLTFDSLSPGFFGWTGLRLFKPRTGLSPLVSPPCPLISVVIPLW